MQMLKIAAAASAAVLLFAAPSYAEDLVFTLTNSTSSVMTTFHASPSGVDSWEEDVLGSEVLGPGESVQVTIADGRDVCEYDMKFDFEELETLTDTQDLCEMGSYTISE